MNVHTGEKNAADVTLAESAAQAIRSGEYSLARRNRKRYERRDTRNTAQSIARNCNKQFCARRVRNGFSGCKKV